MFAINARCTIAKNKEKVPNKFSFFIYGSVKMVLCSNLPRGPGLCSRKKNDKVQLINMRKWPTGFIIFIEEIY